MVVNAVRTSNIRPRFARRKVLERFLLTPLPPWRVVTTFWRVVTTQNFDDFGDNTTQRAPQQTVRPDGRSAGLGSPSHPHIHSVEQTGV
jgi:hypothetical protein